MLGFIKKIINIKNTIGLSAIFLIIISFITVKNPTSLLIIICMMLVIILFFLQASYQKQEINRLKSEYENIKKENEKLLKQNLAMQHSRFNVQSIKEIFEISLFKIESSIYRIMNETVKGPKGNKIRYYGALRIDLEAKYGIEIKEIIVTVDKEDSVIYLNNINPRFIGFTKRKAEWEISEVLEEKSNFLDKIFDKHWRTNNKYEKMLAEKKEEFRKNLENEIETRGIKEFEYLKPLMKEKIEKTLSIFFNQHDYTFKEGMKNGINPVPLVDFIDNPQRYLGE